MFMAISLNDFEILASTTVQEMSDSYEMINVCLSLCALSLIQVAFHSSVPPPSVSFLKALRVS